MKIVEILKEEMSKSLKFKRNTGKHKQLEGNNKSFKESQENIIEGNKKTVQYLKMEIETIKNTQTGGFWK